MRVYLFLNDKIVDFTLPKEIVGSFSFDVDEEEDIKLINIEAKNGGWVIYSTIDVSVLSGENNILEFQQLINNSFYILRRRDINYLIYVSDLSLDKISLFTTKATSFLISGYLDDSLYLIGLTGLFNFVRDISHT